MHAAPHGCVSGWLPGVAGARAKGVRLQPNLASLAFGCARVSALSFASAVVATVSPCTSFSNCCCASSCAYLSKLGAHFVGWLSVIHFHVRSELTHTYLSVAFAGGYTSGVSVLFQSLHLLQSASDFADCGLFPDMSLSVVAWAR